MYDKNHANLICLVGNSITMQIREKRCFAPVVLCVYPPKEWTAYNGCVRLSTTTSEPVYRCETFAFNFYDVNDFLESVKRKRATFQIVATREGEIRFHATGQDFKITYDVLPMTSDYDSWSVAPTVSERVPIRLKKLGLAKDAKHKLTSANGTIHLSKIALNEEVAKTQIDHKIANTYVHVLKKFSNATSADIAFSAEGFSLNFVAKAVKGTIRLPYK